jgi:hypothetical protein
MERAYRDYRFPIADWRFMIAVLVCLTATVEAKYSGGTGEPNDPYQIASADDLLTLAADANDYNQCFILAADIDLDPNLPGRRVFRNAVIARDVNKSNERFDGIAFTGVFDGAGHKIINLTIDTNGVGNDFLGLFGRIASGGEVKNLNLENVSVTGGSGSNYLGGLMGYNAGTISDCSSTGTVIGGDYSVGNYSEQLGGLVGENSGTTSNCYSTGDVTGGNNSGNLGGLVGRNYVGTISNCYSTGNVTGGSDSLYLGGLVGWNFSNYPWEGVSIISSCYSTGNITSGNGSKYLGGLAGANGILGGTISNCYFLDIAGPNNGCGTPLTDEQMKQASNFVGWDFVGETANGYNDFWRLCNDGLEFPKLAWQYLPGDIVCPDGVDIWDLAVLCEQWLFEKIPADVAPPGGDGIVNFADFAVFADQWGVSEDIDTLLDFAEQWLKVGLLGHSADISPSPGGDGIINFADLAVMADYWLEGF